MAWDSWAGITEDLLESDVADPWGIQVKRRASLLAGEWVQEELNDLWQSLLVTGTVWLFPRLKSGG